MTALAVVTDFRVYQSAAQYAKRAGIPQREAVRQVADVQRSGMTARVAVGQLQCCAMRQDRRPFGGDAA